MTAVNGGAIRHVQVKTWEIVEEMVEGRNEYILREE